MSWEMRTLKRKLEAARAVHGRITSDKKDKGPLVLERHSPTAPEPTIKGGEPSSSGVHAPRNRNFEIWISDSDCHSGEEPELVCLSDEEGNIEGLPRATWVAQQREAFRTIQREQAEIPEEALEGETRESQQKVWRKVEAAAKRKVKKATVKKESVTSAQDYAELLSGFVRDPVATRSRDVRTTAAPLPAAAPQDRRTSAKKGGHANPPGFQRSKLPASPFPLPEGSPSLRDPERVARDVLSRSGFKEPRPTLKGFETSLGKESQGEGDPPPECHPAQGPWRNFLDDENDSSRPHQSGRDPAQMSGHGTPADRHGT